MSTYLLEIGTEELPPDLSRSVIPMLKENVLNDLLTIRLSYEDVKVSTTPRRISLIIYGLSSFAEDFVEEIKGPPASQAFKNSQPTNAAIGFAKRCGLDISDLEIRETNKGPFVFAQVVEKGQPTEKLLSSFIPRWISSIQGRRFMRWGRGDIRFSRPIRWIVSLLDNQVIEANISGCDPEVIVSSKTKTHRLFGTSLHLSNASDYFSELLKVGVLADRDSRKSLISDLVKRKADERSASADLSEDLLDELVDLVESPFLVEGSYDYSFLELPAEILCTVMKVHQRYIPLFKSELINDSLAMDSRDVLLPNFFCISNGLLSASDLIISGNERVLRARFSDAEFFFNADLSTPTEDRLKKLSSVTFAGGLGSLLDRVGRIGWVVENLITNLSIDEKDISYSKRAAYLCKHDLVSKIVGEFPELQGTIGAKYLLAEGEPREVCVAVLEHYLPRGSGDALPESLPGSILAIAERLELLVSIFVKGERPSGSSDPYALRRAGNGIFQILWHKQLNIDIPQLLQRSIEHWNKLFPSIIKDSDKIIEELLEFLRQRFIFNLEDSSIDSDVIKAVLENNISNENILSYPEDVRIRSSLLMHMRSTGKLSSIHSVVTRASRLALKSSLSLKVIEPGVYIKPYLFEKQSEIEMFNLLTELEPIVKSNSKNKYDLLAKSLASSAEKLSNFFDGDQSVMVMTDNLELRNNRLNLLAILRNQSLTIGDFSKLSS